MDGMNDVVTSGQLIRGDNSSIPILGEAVNARGGAYIFCGAGPLVLDDSARTGTVVSVEISGVVPDYIRCLVTSGVGIEDGDLFDSSCLVRGVGIPYVFIKKSDKWVVAK